MTRKKKNESVSTRALMQDKVATKIGEGIHKIQLLWAGWISRQSSKLSPFTLKLVLGLYFSVMAAVSFFYLLTVFRGSDKVRADIVQGTVRLPSFDRSDQSLIHGEIVPEELFDRIQSFKKSMDSLATTPQGLRKRDSLLLGRPHLLDSISEIQRIYLMQH